MNTFTVPTVAQNSWGFSDEGCHLLFPLSGTTVTGNVMETETGFWFDVVRNGSGTVNVPARVWLPKPGHLKDPLGTNSTRMANFNLDNPWLDSQDWRV